MGKEKDELKILYCVGMVFLLIVTTFVPLSQSDFILPPWGGGMVHQDPSMSENIWLPGDLILLFLIFIAFMIDIFTSGPY